MVTFAAKKQLKTGRFRQKAEQEFRRPADDPRLRTREDSTKYTNVPHRAFERACIARRGNLCSSLPAAGRVSFALPFRGARIRLSAEPTCRSEVCLPSRPPGRYEDSGPGSTLLTWTRFEFSS